jgi:hypothetical protein
MASFSVEYDNGVKFSCHYQTGIISLHSTTDTLRANHMQLLVIISYYFDKSIHASRNEVTIVKRHY